MSLFDLADPHHFRYGDPALHGQLDAAIDQGLPGHVVTGTARETGRVLPRNKLGERLRERQHLVYTETTPFAGSAAVAAARTGFKTRRGDPFGQLLVQPKTLLRGRRIVPRAAFADEAHQALGNDGLERSRHHVGGYPHIEQTDR